MGSEVLKSENSERMVLKTQHVRKFAPLVREALDHYLDVLIDQHIKDPRDLERRRKINRLDLMLGEVRRSISQK